MSKTLVLIRRNAAEVLHVLADQINDPNRILTVGEMTRIAFMP
jgi:hypothetical protein